MLRDERLSRRLREIVFEPPRTASVRAWLGYITVTRTSTALAFPKLAAPEIAGSGKRLSVVANLKISGERTRRRALYR
jgi:hypothetical protein